MKAFFSMITLLAVLCLSISPGISTAAGESAAVPSADSVEETAGEPDADALPEPTPWTGDGHWYTFQIIGDSGLISSVNIRYIPLYEVYYISEETAVAIGKVKGMASDVIIYTNDPEERVIWSFSPNGFLGIFRRSGYELPDPGPETGDLALYAGDDPFILSAAAQSELYALQESVGVSGTPFEASDCGIDPDGSFDAEVIFEYREIPYLGVWTAMDLTRYEDRLMLLSWKEDDQTNGFQPDRILEISPESELYRVFFEFFELSGQETSSDQEQP